MKLYAIWVLLESKHGKRSVGGQARVFVNLLEVEVPRNCLLTAMCVRVGWRKRAGEGGWVE